MCDSVPFHYMSDEQIHRFAVVIVSAVVRNPDLYLDTSITPRDTPRTLMKEALPARWRIIARSRWLVSLRARVIRAMFNQRDFARAIQKSRVPPL